MPNVANPVGTTQDYIPAVPSTQIQKYAGLAMHYPDFASFTAGVTAERGNVSASSALWADGQPITISGEPPAAHRYWSVSLNHARSVRIGTQTIILASDSNKVLSTNGAPSSGTGANGDIAVDGTAGLIYTKASGSWGVPTNSSGLSTAQTAAVVSDVDNAWAAPNMLAVNATPSAPAFTNAMSSLSGLFYWPGVIKVRGRLSTPLDNYYMYYSTDHDVTNGGIALATGPTPIGPWTDHGLVYVDTTGTSTTGGGETETPSPVWDPVTSQIRIFYQEVASNMTSASGSLPALGAAQSGQSTMACVSSDGVTFTRDDGFRIDTPPKAFIAGVGHTGYFTPWYGPGGRLCAYSLYSSGNYAHFAMHLARGLGTGDWQTDPRVLGQHIDLCDMGDSVERYVSWNCAIAVKTRQGMALVAMLTDFVSASNPRQGCVAIAPLSHDCRTPIGQFQRIWTATQSWETNNIRSVTYYVEGGVLYIYIVHCTGTDVTVSGAVKMSTLTYQL